MAVSTPSQPGQLHIDSRFSCKLFTSTLMEKSYIIRAIVNNPLLLSGEGSGVTSNF